MRSNVSYCRRLMHAVEEIWFLWFHKFHLRGASSLYEIHLDIFKSLNIQKITPRVIKVRSTDLDYILLTLFDTQYGRSGITKSWKIAFFWWLVPILLSQKLIFLQNAHFLSNEMNSNLFFEVVQLFYCAFKSYNETIVKNLTQK